VSSGYRSTLVQQAWCAVVDAQTVEEGASLSTLRWCGTRIIEGGVATPTVVAGAATVVAIAFPLPLLPLLGVGARG
jgi:hypothetical protein